MSLFVDLPLDNPACQPYDLSKSYFHASVQIKPDMFHLDENYPYSNIIFDKPAILSTDIKIDKIRSGILTRYMRYANEAEGNWASS
jgi:hypothetical protein